MMARIELKTKETPFKAVLPRQMVGSREQVILCRVGLLFEVGLHCRHLDLLTG